MASMSLRAWELLGHGSCNRRGGDEHKRDSHGKRVQGTQSLIADCRLMTSVITVACRDALLSSTTTIWWNSHARTPSPLVGRSRYGPKRQVQGDPVTLEKSSPN